MTADTGFEIHGAAEKRMELSKKTIETLLAEYPFIEDFFAENRLTELHILDNTQRTFDFFYKAFPKRNAKIMHSIEKIYLMHSLNTSFKWNSF